MLSQIIHRIKYARKAYPTLCLLGSLLTFFILVVLPMVFPPPGLSKARVISPFEILTFVTLQLTLYILLSWALPALVVSCFIKRK